MFTASHYPNLYCSSLVRCDTPHPSFISHSLTHTRILTSSSSCYHSCSGKLDATADNAKATAGKFSISGYPTLKIFRNGKASDYNGPRETAGIVTYMKKQVGPAAKVLKDRKEVENFIRSDKATNYAIIGFFQTSDKPSQLSSSFSLISTRLRDDFIFGKVLDEPELAKKYGITDDNKNEGIVVFLHGEPTVYTGTSKQKEVEDFLRASSTPLIGLITEQNQDVYQKRGLPVAKVFMKTDGKLNSKNTKYFTNRYVDARTLTLAFDT
jgi:hypothetical protein